MSQKKGFHKPIHTGFYIGSKKIKGELIEVRNNTPTHVGTAVVLVRDKKFLVPFNTLC